MISNINSLIIGCIALAVQPIFAREALSIDFFDGIPESFSLEDRDGNTLSDDVKKYGFEQGDAWVAYFIPGEKDMVAASTSWYAVPGTSDDRMILPAWKVAAGDMLQWWGRSADKYVPNAYKVLALCDGIETILFSSEGEKAEWAFHQVALDDFVGKPISLAFVDCSTDASLLYIDDIRLGASEKLFAELDVPVYVTESAPFYISGLLSTDLPSGIEGQVMVRTSVNGKEQTLDLGRVRLTPGSVIEFKMPEAAVAGSVGIPMAMSYEVNLDGSKVYGGEKTLIPAVNYAVCEEITGTWCAWCVKGIATFEKLDSLYPESFIGIAIHDSDVMSEGVTKYQNMIYSYGKASGLPFAFMMRNSEYTSDFSKYEEVVKQINAKPLSAFIETTVGAPEGNSYPLSTSVTLTEDMVDDNYRLAYVLIENDVFDPENPEEYTQNNAYADGEHGECGGFESKPSPIENVHFEHVARAYVGDYKGIFASLPERMQRDKTYVSNNTLEVLDNILKTENCELITLLIDTDSACIVAADKLPLIGGSNAVGNISVTNDMDLNGRIANVPAGCAHVSVVDITGRIMIESEGDNPVDLSSLCKGIYVVSAVTANGIISRVFAIN